MNIWSATGANGKGVLHKEFYSSYSYIALSTGILTAALLIVSLVSSGLDSIRWDHDLHGGTGGYGKDESWFRVSFFFNPKSIKVYCVVVMT